MFATPSARKKNPMHTMIRFMAPLSLYP